jgi:DNA-binding response OmpR family regulator
MKDSPKRTIVCIEDEPEMVDLIRKRTPDLVLLDLMMPDMDGWEVYQQLKAGEQTRDIPVIVVTAKAQSIDKVLGLHIAKVDDYIAKPFSPQDLLASVEKVLQNQVEQQG